MANSPYTVLGECMSAGRLYDRIGDEAEAEIMYVLPQGVVCIVIHRRMMRRRAPVLKIEDAAIVK